MGTTKSKPTTPNLSASPFTALHSSLPFLQSIQRDFEIQFANPHHHRIFTELTALLTLMPGPLCDNTLLSNLPVSTVSKLECLATVVSTFIQQWTHAEEPDYALLLQNLCEQSDKAEIHTLTTHVQLCLPPPRETTTKDQLQVYFLLRRKLPAELVLAVMDQAEYYITTTTTRFDALTIAEADSPTAYLLTPRAAGKIVAVHFTIASHDQGWSSYPEDHGTYRGSWTWFGAAVVPYPLRYDSSSVGEDKEIELCRNRHAGRNTEVQEVVVKGVDLVGENGGRGAAVEVRAHARYPGWSNTVWGMRVVVLSSVL